MSDHEFGQGDFSDYLSQTSIFEQDKSEQQAVAPARPPEPAGRSSLGWEGRIGLGAIGVLTMVLACLVCFRISQALRRAEPKMAPPRVVRDFSKSRLASKAAALPIENSAYAETPAPIARLSYAADVSASAPVAVEAAVVEAAAPSTLSAAAGRASSWAPRPIAATEAARYEPDHDTNSPPSSPPSSPPLPPPNSFAETVERGQKPTERPPIEPPPVESTPTEPTPAARAVAPSRQPPQLAPGAAYKARRYVIQSGDTLPAIAQRELGERRRWLEIWQLNAARLQGDMSRLQPGTELVMPGEITTTARSARAGKRRQHSPGVLR